MPHHRKQFPSDARRALFEQRYTFMKQDASFVYVKEKRTGLTLKIRKHVCRGPWCGECGKTIVRKITPSESRMTGSAYTNAIGAVSAGQAVGVGLRRSQRDEIALARRMARILDIGYKNDVYWFRKGTDVDYVGDLGQKRANTAEDAKAMIEAVVGRDAALPGL